MAPIEGEVMAKSNEFRHSHEVSRVAGIEHGVVRHNVEVKHDARSVSCLEQPVRAQWRAAERAQPEAVP